MDPNPVVVTGTRGQLLLGKTKDEYVKYGFFECPLESELKVASNFFRELSEISGSQRWTNQVDSLELALQTLRGSFEGPQTVIADFRRISGLTGVESEEARNRMAKFGLVLDRRDTQYLALDFSDPAMAVVCVAPNLLGWYTRSDDYLGIILTNVNTKVVFTRIDENSVDRGTSGLRPESS